jgi:hypothetical protein
VRQLWLAGNKWAKIAENLEDDAPGKLENIGEKDQSQRNTKSLGNYNLGTIGFRMSFTSKLRERQMHSGNGTGKKGFGVVLFLGLLSLGACTGGSGTLVQPDPSSAETSPPQNETNTQQLQYIDVTPYHIDVTPYLNFVSYWPVPKNRRIDPMSRTVLQGAYMRLFAVSDKRLFAVGDMTHDNAEADKTEGQARPNPFAYEGRKRNLLERLIHGESKSAVLVANVSIRNPNSQINHQTTMPLLTITHDSNSDVGEAFLTDVTDSMINTPYFKVGPSSTISTQFEIKTSKTITSKVVRLVLESINTLASVASPTSPLVTKLNKDSVNNRAVGDVIGRLFSETVSETIRSERTINDWKPGSHFQVYLDNIMREMFDSKQVNQLGTWTVQLAPPRPSMFSDVEYYCLEDLECGDSVRKAAFENLSASSVLNFQVATNVSLGDYLLGEDWFVEGVTNFPSESGQRLAFCKKIVNALEKLGLNRDDSLAGLWASVNGLPLPDGVQGNFSNGCKSMHDAFESLQTTGKQVSYSG